MSNLSGSSDSGREQDGISNLYIGPLASKLRHYEILSHFSVFGDVDDVRIHTQTEYSYKFENGVRICNETKVSYGFVKFTLAKSAAKALQVDFHIIGGRRVNVVVADDRHQDWTALPSLNDDCILEILSNKCLSANDLCSVAETSHRLKELAVRVFRREHKTCDIRSLSERKAATAKRILMHFGSVVRHLQITGIDENWSREILDYVTASSCNTLQSLDLFDINIHDNLTVKLRPLFSKLQKLTLRDCFFEGASKELIADCVSLVELEIGHFGSDVTTAEFILEKTFPKLQRFGWYYGLRGAATMDLLYSFISRHKNLKSLLIWYCVCPASILQVIADCTRLETLECGIDANATLDLSNLGHLRKLDISCDHRRVSETALGLKNLQFLKYLTVTLAEIDSQFVRTLSQLQRLEVFNLGLSTGLENLNQIGDLGQLTSLQIYSLENVDLDVVRLIKRLSKLNYLRLAVRGGFEMDLAKYLKIVDTVQRRPDRSKLKVQLSDHVKVDYGKLLPHFARNAHLVEMIKE